MASLEIRMECLVTEASIFISKVVLLSFTIFMFPISQAEEMSLLQMTKRKYWCNSKEEGEKLLQWAFGSGKAPSEALININE